jgi:hypothetical protein
MGTNRTPSRAGLAVGILLLVVYCISLIVVDVENYKNSLAYKNQPDVNLTVYYTHREVLHRPRPRFPWALRNKQVNHTNGGRQTTTEFNEGAESGTNGTASHTTEEITTSAPSENNTGGWERFSLRPVRVQSKCLKRKCKINTTAEAYFV